MNDKLHEGLPRFCQEIAGAVPVAVPVAMEPWAEPDFCFVNIQKKVDEHGGSMQVGWLFVHGPVADTSGFLVAIHHAVWRSLDGSLLEITPIPDAPILSDDHGEMLFLPDDQATLEKPVGFEVGVARPCQFFPLSKNKKVLERVRLGRQIEWQNWRAGRSAGRQKAVAIASQTTV